MRQLVTLVLISAAGLSVHAQQWIPVPGAPPGLVLCQTISADTCQAAGGGGRLYVTRDGGATFDSVQTIFTTEWFNDMHFPTSQVGYACGGSDFGFYKNIIAKTMDGGNTWFPLTHDEYPWFSFWRIRFFNPDIGLVSGDVGTFMRTEDGGDTFTPIDLGLPGINSVNDIYFDGDVGYICTRATQNNNDDIYHILKSTDLGQSWNILYSDTVLSRTVNTDRGVQCVRFIGQSGMACGYNGLLLRTTDGGATWTENTLATGVTTLFGLEMVNGQLAFITTMNAYAGEIRNTLRTGDGGVTWTTLPEKFLSVSVKDGTGYAVDDAGHLFKNAEVTNDIREVTPEPITLFPNPSTGDVNLELPKTMADSHIYVYDGNGRTVLERQVSGQRGSIFKVNDLATGLYVVKVMEDRTGKTYRQRLVVQ